MLRHLSVIVALLMATVFVVPLAAQIVEDEYTTNIPILLDGQTISGVFYGDVGTHLYSFNASEGDRISIEMNALNEYIDPFLILLGPRGEVLAYDDDGGMVAGDALISDIKLPESGGYFVLVTTYENVDDILEIEHDEAMEYALSINGITPPVDLPDFEEDQVLFYRGIIQIDESLLGESTVEEPVYYFVFTASEDDVLDLFLESEDFDPLLQVFDAYGNRIAVNNNEPSGQYWDSAVYDLEIPEDGTYLILATDKFYYNAGVKDADLAFNGGEFYLTIQTSE